MMHLRTLIFTSVMLPGILTFAAKDEYLEATQPQNGTRSFQDYLSDQEVSSKAIELPTCLLCVCLSGSVYCEEVSPEMSTVPALPRETAYLYARFNKITKIRNGDFADMVTLRRIDLSGNVISEIEDGAFSKLINLEELSLAENRLTKLPMLPTKLVSFNANSNRLRTQEVKATAFKNNRIETVTDRTFCQGNSSHYIRINMFEVRLDGNPIRLSRHPESFICLQSLPFGWYN